jgi:heme-degrading monooxygenase HmoA
VFVRIWQYRAKPGSEREFEELYGPAGAWAQLFQVAAGYLGTELRRAPDAPDEYQTLDRWESRAAWEAFRQRHGAAYESLDRRCELLTASETLVAEWHEAS